MRLAFVVVYLVRGDAQPLFHRHLEFIRRYAPDCEWWLKAITHRAPDAVRATLAADPGIRLHTPEDLPPPAVEGASAEHGAYLDAMIECAILDGATHICTLDDDSFPVRADWLDVALGHLDAGQAMVAAMRAENGDSDLPHPSFLVTTADFWREHRPRFLLPRGTSPEFDAYLRQHRQRPDTGIGYGFAAHRAGLPWAKLLRSNVVDDHYLMSGLYADIAFHFGGANRRKIFARDMATARRAADRDAALDMIGRANQAMSEAMLARIAADMDGYLAHLRGG